MIVVIGNIRTATYINTITNTIQAKLVIEPRYHLLDQQHHYQILSTFFIKTALWLSSTSGTRRWRCWKLCLSSPWATWSLDRWASICSWWWWQWWWCRWCPTWTGGHWASICSWWWWWWCRCCPAETLALYEYCDVVAWVHSWESLLFNSFLNVCIWFLLIQLNA